MNSDQTQPAPRPPVFFTGGTALRELSRTFARSGADTVHLVTTFDSGGSTARLRAAFAMPAVGDLRNRLVALADTSRCGEEILRCLETRLPAEGDPEDLRLAVRAMADPDHPVWRGVSPLPARTLQDCLQAFLRNMPAAFDARQACLGNLCMAGKYLLEHRSLSGAMALFARLLHIRGQILPIVEESLHLAAELADGSLLTGQHLFKNLPSPVRRLFLTVHEPGRGSGRPEPCRPRAAAPALARLRSAGLVCYPMGSFFSSVLANLLADGVGKAVAGLDCPKVFIPNTGTDSELLGLSLRDQVRCLLSVLGQDAPDAGPSDFLTHVLLDRRSGRYPGDPDELARELKPLGIRVADENLVLPDGRRHDPEATAAWLLRAVRSL